jgi:hypothetical protein
MILGRTIAALLAAPALLMCGALGAMADDIDAPETKHVRGWLELARVQPVNLLMRAKLDSGALTSAIHAEILRGPGELGFPEELPEGVEIDDADGSDAETVVFALESRTGKRVVFQREIVRWVNIKLRGGGATSRPVVQLGFCVAGVPMEGEVSLTDRDNFNYPILVGRRMLTDAGVIIDPSKTFTYHSRCYDDGPHPNLD